MKNILYAVIVLLLLSCCFPTIKREESYYITNTTGKKLIHQIMYYNAEGGKGLDTLSFYSSGTSAEAEFEWMVTGTYNAQKPIDVVSKTNIYNLSDTTSLGWSHAWSVNGIYTRFAKKTDVQSYKDNEYKVEKLNVYLTIDDELLSLMKKDYTMLDKFKEYYK